MERLRLGLLTPSPTALERFCEAMPHITNLYLSLGHQPKGYNENNSYDGVLRAIAGNMPHLKLLNISFCTVEPRAIEYLLPTEENALGGCPELVELYLYGIICVDVKLLKKILLALPKLRYLKHELLVNALADLTEEEMGVDTARSLYCLSSWIDQEQFKNLPSVRYEILSKSPVFQRLKNNITTACVTINEQEHNESALVADVLLSLSNLRSIQLGYISEASKHFLPVLESIGDRLQELSLYDSSSSLCVDDIMRACPNIEWLTIVHRSANNALSSQIKKPSKLPVLSRLKLLCLKNISGQMCSVDMLIALLQSPNLNHIRLEHLEAMSDDVMFNVLSSPGCAVLSKVSEFLVNSCPMITAEPFVQWLNREDCPLQCLSSPQPLRLRFYNCEKIDCKILVSVAEKCPRALIIVEK